MPMDFPDMKSLIMAAKAHNFREPKEGEEEKFYRAALSTHVADIDFIESEEIRNGVGWDKFTDEQNRGMLLRNQLKVLKEAK